MISHYIGPSSPCLCLYTWYSPSCSSYPILPFAYPFYIPLLISSYRALPNIYHSSLPVFDDTLANHYDNLSFLVFIQLASSKDFPSLHLFFLNSGFTLFSYKLYHDCSVIMRFLITPFSCPLPFLALLPFFIYLLSLPLSSHRCSLSYEAKQKRVRTIPVIITVWT